MDLIVAAFFQFAANVPLNLRTKWNTKKFFSKPDQKMPKKAKEKKKPLTKAPYKKKDKSPKGNCSLKGA